MDTFALAWRGLRRNTRRSLAAALSIALGFAAVGLFSGYTRNVYAGLADQAVHGELLGHLTVARRGMRTAGRLHPEQFWQVHRGILVNVRHIASARRDALGRLVLHLKTRPERLPVSRAYAHRFRQM